MDNRLKVLIVDDNKLNIKVEKRIIEGFNFDIEECYDGDECLALINSGKRYDLILMDIMMPNVDGLTTLLKLKENPNFYTPVIAVTADAVEGSKEKYLNAGFIDYVTKPTEKDILVDSIKKVIEIETLM